MVSVLGLDQGKVEELCAKARGIGQVEIANLLGPGNIVVSGTKAACAEVERLAPEMGAMKTITLTVAGAFQRYHLGGLLDPKKDVSNQVVSAKFKAKGRITLSAIFSADVDSAVVKMQFVNFDSLGTATKSVPPTQLNESFFDDIGRYVTREPSNLFQEALPDSYRSQLRTKVQQEQIKRRWESKISAQGDTELEKLKREQSLANKFGKLVGKDKDKPAAAEKPADTSWLDRLKGLVKKDK